MSGVAGAAAASGDYDRAEQIARSLTDPYWQARTLADAATAAASGDRDRARWLTDEAERIARSIITHPNQQVRAVAAVAAAAAVSGDSDRARELMDDAERVARTIIDPYWQAQTLADMAAAAPRPATMTGPGG